eukprot:g8867.t1
MGYAPVTGSYLSNIVKQLFNARYSESSRCAGVFTLRSNRYRSQAHLVPCHRVASVELIESTKSYPSLMHKVAQLRLFQTEAVVSFSSSIFCFNFLIWATVFTPCKELGTLWPLR